MKHPVGKTKNGVPVYVDLIASKAAKHIAEQPYLLQLIKEVLKGVEAHDPDLKLEKDMGRAIGYDFVVNTTPKDIIFYAQLSRDEVYTRFVKNGQPHSTQYLSIELHRHDNSYELQDAWIGRLSPPRPGSGAETTDSLDYWSVHAVVLDKQSLQLRTLTKVCPY
jgi:hypothetical protein